MTAAFVSAGTPTTGFGSVTAAAPSGIVIANTLILIAGEFFGTNSPPTLAGWTNISLYVNWTTGAGIWLKSAAGSDTIPSVSFSGSQFHSGVCLQYSGISSTLDSVSNDRAYNSTNSLAFNSLSSPTNNGSLVLAISFRNKTSTTDSATVTETGGLVGATRRCTLWPSGNSRQTIIVDEFIQTTAAAISSPGANVSLTESVTQTGHSTILVFPSGSPPTFVPSSPMNQGGIGVQMCQ